jgi:hypothetical protein
MATASRTQLLAWSIGLAAVPQAPRMFMPRPPRALLRVDALTVTRAFSTTVDSEGDETAGRWVVLTDRGTLGTLSANEQQVAAQRGDVIDKALNVVLGMDLQLGDWATVKGSTYEVITVDDNRLCRRAQVRKL